MGADPSLPDDDALVFADEGPASAADGEQRPRWPVLMVDDDPHVHTVTRLVLRDLEFGGTGIELLAASGAEEAKAVIEARPDIALVLLDVVMESDDAGLRLVEYIRLDRGNSKVRIILRTGQPGLAPEREVIVRYDINDYKSKSELTAQGLLTAILGALRNYRDIQAQAALVEQLDRARREERRMLEIVNAIAQELHLDTLLGKIISAAAELLDADRGSLFLHDPATGELWSRVAQGLTSREIRFPDSAGIAGACFQSGAAVNIPDAYADSRFNQEFDHRTGYRTRTILCVPVRTKDGRAIGVVQVLNRSAGIFTRQDEDRLSGFAAQVATTLENARLFEEIVRLKDYNDSILKSLKAGVVTLDGDQQVATLNQAAEQILDVAADAVHGLPIDAVFPNDGWIAEGVARVVGTGRSDVALDSDITLGSGQQISVNLTTVPLVDLAEKPIGSLLVIEDIGGEKRLKSTMARYLTKEVMDRLLTTEGLELGGQLQEVTVLFSDIRQFTSISETIGARATVDMLNEYFAAMIDVIFAHGGILDKFIGDAIMALFGAPLPTPADADQSVRVACAMLAALDRLNAERHLPGQPPLRIGIGISTGEVIAGNIGSPKRMEYTVIGDAVNLAARLEAATKHYQAPIVISELTRARLTRPAALRELDLIRVRGRRQPVAIYQVLDYLGPIELARRQPLLDRFADGIATFRRRDWRHAARTFADIIAADPADTPARLYADRCQRFLDQPPPPDWDGVWPIGEAA